MNNLTKSFKIAFTVMLCIVLLGIIFACVLGVNSFATLGKGQALTYKIDQQSDDYSDTISTVKSFLRDKGAKMITVQTVYDYRDDVDSLVFYFNAKNDIDSTVTIGDKSCVVSKLQTEHSVDVVKMGAVAAAVAIVVIFGYLALRYLKNNWLANSLGFIIMAMLNIFTSYGLVQILGLVGFQFDSSIMTACIYTVMITALLYSLFTSYVRNLARIKKISGDELLIAANQSIWVYTLIVAVVIVAVCLLLSIIMGAAFTIVLIPVVVSTIVCYLSSLFVSPYIWRILQDKNTVVASSKSGKSEN